MLPNPAQRIARIRFGILKGRNHIIVDSSKRRMFRRMVMTCQHQIHSILAEQVHQIISLIDIIIARMALTRVYLEEMRMGE